MPNGNDILIFEKHFTVKLNGIKLCTSSQHTGFDLLAVVTGSGDVLLYCLYPQCTTPILRWVPWFDDIRKKIQAFAFSPGGGKWLLTVCSDGSLYLLPVYYLLNLPESSSENGVTSWLNDDVTYLPSIISPDFIPSAVAWWRRYNVDQEHRDIAIIGSVNGSILVFSLTTVRVILTTRIEGCVSSIDICDHIIHTSVVISNEKGCQWRLLLQDSAMQNEPEESFTSREMETQNSRLHGLKQLSANTFSNIKKKITKEARTKSSSVVIPDDISEGTLISYPSWQLDVLLENICSTTLFAQPSSLAAKYPHELLSIESLTSTPSKIYKLTAPSSLISLTDSLILFTNPGNNKVHILSQKLSECRGSYKYLLNAESSLDCLVQEIDFGDNETIIKVFCTCPSKHRFILVTTFGIYHLYLREEPESLILKNLLDSEKLHLGEKFSFIFGLDLQKFILEAADVQMSNGAISEAIQLFNLSKNGSLRSISMLAVSGHVKELLRILVAQTGNVQKLLIVNLKILAFVHEYLISPNPWLYLNLMETLQKGVYDEALAVSILAQAGLCRILLIVTKERGLQSVTVTAISNALQRTYSVDIARCEGFWELMSEITLCEALLFKTKSLKVHLNYIQEHLPSVSLSILLKLEALYNPFNVSVWQYIQYNKEHERSLISMWVQTYLFICIHISSNYSNYTPEKFSMFAKECPFLRKKQKNVLTPKKIGAGFSHTCAILNGDVYTWGSTSGGSLGTGPSNNQAVGPSVVDLFLNLGIKVLSVSCGKAHTLALTTIGVFSWGSNQYGQLGLGNVMPSCFPRSIDVFLGHDVISIACGQYHSIAVDDDHRVYSWGWGVHGQLGHGNVEDYHLPKLIAHLSNKEINFCEAGHAHSLFLDSMGRVWACGSSVFGQLGTGDQGKSSYPLQIYGLPEKITHLAAGYFHNVALAEGGRVYQWGCSPNILRAAAHAAKRKMRTMAVKMDTDDSLSYLSPTLIDTSHVSGEIIKVTAGNEHSALITKEGSVYTWGRNVDGQLGNTAPPNQRNPQHVLHPTLINMETAAEDICCGSDYTVVIDALGNVWTWGVSHHTPAARTALSSLEGEVVMVNNKNRVIRLHHNSMYTQPLPTLLAMPVQNSNNYVKPEIDYTFYSPPSDWRKRMHLAIETLGDFYSVNELIDKCKELGESDAGAKLAHTLNDISSAINFLLKMPKELAEFISIVKFYLPLTFGDLHTVSSVLTSVISFWNNQSLPVSILEDIFFEHWEDVVNPLGYLLYRSKPADSNSLFSKFSTAFNLKIVQHMVSSKGGGAQFIFPDLDNEKDVISAIISDDYIDIENLTSQQVNGVEEISYSTVLSLSSQNVSQRHPFLYKK